MGLGVVGPHNALFSVVLGCLDEVSNENLFSVCRKTVLVGCILAVVLCCAAHGVCICYDKILMVKKETFVWERMIFGMRILRVVALATKDRHAITSVKVSKSFFFEDNIISFFVKSEMVLLSSSWILIIASSYLLFTYQE